MAALGVVNLSMIALAVQAALAPNNTSVLLYLWLNTSLQVIFKKCDHFGAGVSSNVAVGEHAYVATFALVRRGILNGS